MYLKVMAMLACFSVSAGAHAPCAHAEKNRKPLQGEDKVKWEDKWYPLEDGQGKKLMARRGLGQGNLWIQIRNDYDEPISCTAQITSILHEGEKARHLLHLHNEPGETATIPYLPGEEICKAEISDFVLEKQAVTA